MVKGVKKCCISNAVDGTDDMLWNAVLVVSVSKMKVLTVKMETVTLIGRGK